MLKKVCVSLILTVGIFGGNLAYSGTIAFPYEVGLWQGFRTAAISYTFDDGTANQLPVAIPMFNEFNFDATLFTVTNWVTDWNSLQNAANQGHEIASHTVTHSRLSGMSIADQTVELRDSKNAITANIPTNQCFTIAYPNCRSGDQTLCSQYYIAGRNCSGAIESSTPANPFEIPAFICGSRGTIKTFSDFVDKNTAAAAARGWCVYLLHGIDNDGGYSPLASSVLRQSLQFLDTNKAVFWVSTFSNVIRYIQERNSVSVSEQVDLESITVQVTDTLVNSVYNFPLSLRRPLPAGWADVTVTQAGHTVNSSIVTVNSVPNVMFDAVPDGGVIVLNKSQGASPAAPSGLTATAGNATVSLDWNDNGEPDLTGYNVYRSAGACGPYGLIAPNVAASAYVDNNVVNNTAYCYVVSAVNASGSESAYSNQASATPTSGGVATIHVESIAVAWVSAGGQNKKGQATVVVKDNLGNPVSNATVNGTFSGKLNESRSGTTDATGTVVIKTNAFTKTTGSITFCVADVTHATLSYAPASNVETCDSAQ
jgi:hypothetical protein